MKHAKSAIALMVIASLVVPAVHAKSKRNPPPPPITTSQPNSESQAGGLPATNARVTALEGAVVALRADLVAEIAARQAADTRLANALNNEIAARQAADTALANQIGTIPRVFVGEGSVDVITGATVTVASKTVPAGTYFILTAVQMTNSQTGGDANARCVLRADGNLLADTSDLQFPILTTAAGPPSPALGSTMFASLQGSYNSTSPIAVVVECTESNGESGGLTAFAHIAAMKAGTIE